MSRRRFVQAAALGGVGMLAGCAGVAAPAAAPVAAPAGAPAATPVSAAGAAKRAARVAFVRTADRAEGVRRALALYGDLGWAGKSVLLKPNFNSADPAPGSTHPDVLRALVEGLRARGAGSLTVADRSGMGDTRTVMNRLGVDRMAEELAFDLVVLDELAADEWETVNLPGSHWSRGFALPKLVRTVDAVVQACCLKTHRFGGHFTLSLKNSVGLAAKRVPGDDYNYMTELHGSDHQRRMIAEINAAYPCAMAVLDGVEAFVRGGPDSGERVAANVVLASPDRVALDAVGVALLRYFGTTPEVSAGRIFEQQQLARAVELGLGASGPHEIELVTDDGASAAFAAEIRTMLDQG